MRRNIVICLALVVLVSGCAYQGTIVEKRFRPLPFSASLGVDAMYNFQLRDNTQQIHSQMVTPDVFASYRAGDYFNDLESPPAHDEKELEGFRLLPREMDEGPYQPVRVMQNRQPQKAVARVSAHAYNPLDGAVKIPRWQTVRIVQIQALQPAGAKVAIQAPDHAQNEVRIARWHTVRMVQIQPRQRAVAEVTIQAPDRIENEMKIPRSQTVRIVEIQPMQRAAAKVAGHASEHAESDVKILRWQTVRIVQIQPPQKTAAKAPVHARQHVKSAVKTASPLPKVASRHNRRTVASLN